MTAPMSFNKGAIVWFTGLPCSGKTTIGRFLLEKLAAGGFRAELLDADLLRASIGRGLGYKKEDREENVRRIAFVAGLLAKHDVIVLVAAISPYRWLRDQLRAVTPGWVEVYVDAPLSVCAERDVKGLYLKARLGELPHFTGIDDPYEPPPDPCVVCRTDRETVEESAGRVWEWLRKGKYISVDPRGTYES